MTLHESGSPEEPWNAEEAALAELIDKAVAAAILDKASDIHIDPGPKDTRLRYRIDGVMQEVLTYPKSLHEPLIGRIKLMGDMDRASQRTVQYGRFAVDHEGRPYDIRATILPSLHGEKATLRILDRAVSLLGLDRMYFRDSDRERLEQCLRLPSGLLIFSGPQGSGKTTTMYGGLQRIDPNDRVTMTIEDPVEYTLPGITQIDANRRFGISAADALRGVIRADPDIVMIGEVSDPNVAGLAVKLAMTGHLVLTQLPTQDAPSALLLLEEFGIDRFLLASSVAMISNQRLIRQICPECKEEIEYPQETVAEWRARAVADGMVWPEGFATFYQGRGCDHCHNTGYRGRMALYEILVMDPELNRMLAERRSIGEIRKAAIQKGMTGLFADGVTKALAGQTSMAEIMRVLAFV